MFHIIDRPPFDDFTFELFTTLFKNRSQYGLKNAEFIYTWTAHMSSPKGRIISKDLFYPGATENRPTTVTDLYFWNFGYENILGDNKLVVHADDLYEDFLKTMTDYPDFEKATFQDFLESYNSIHGRVKDKKQIEYRIHDIIKKTDTVVLFVKDHFRVELSKSWYNPSTELAEYYSNMFEYYNNKRFVLVTSLENLDKEINQPNCTIIPMGGDVTNQIKNFGQYHPCTAKISKEKQSISLNRGQRNHRTYLVSMLYGMGADKYTDISYLGLKDFYGELKDALKYDYLMDDKYEVASSGFSKFLTAYKAYDDIEIYQKATANDNIYNFNNSLIEKYSSSFLEFVTETNYNEPSFNVTEKFSHSVFGYNIPIFVSSPGYVDFIRSMGFDVFDDIIDHSYDEETDKLKRIHKLVNNNLDLISSGNLDKFFLSNKSRFDNNYSRIVNDLASFYQSRFWKLVEKSAL